MNDSPENRTDGSERPEDKPTNGDITDQTAADSLTADHSPADSAGQGDTVRAPDAASDAPQPPQPVPGPPAPPDRPAAQASPPAPSQSTSSYAPPMPGSAPQAFGNGQQPAPYGQSTPYGQPNARHYGPQAPYGQQPSYGQAGPSAHPYSQQATAPVGAPAQGSGNQSTGNLGTGNDGTGKPGSDKKKRGSIPLIAALAVGALVGGVSGAGVAAFAVANSGSSQSPTAANPANVTVNDGADATVITAVAASAGPSVVTISVTDGSGRGAGTGSGVILSEDGYVLTNTHVVTLDGASATPTVSVQTSDGRLYQAEVIGTDPISDLAVLKIDGSGFQAAEFADSSELNVGDTAVAIGSPLGLSNTVTNGIVSSLNRSITVASSAAPETPEDQAPEGDSGDSPFDFWQFGQEPEDPGQSAASSTISLSVIQTDAAINPGNSGGALLDAEGKVIGINVAIASAGQGQAQSAAGSIGVGFAIPSNLAKRIAEEIIDTGSGSHGLLGAGVNDVTASDATVVGALIENVQAGGAAEAAGLQAGDIVTKVGDIPVTNRTDLTAQIRALAAGAETTLTYVRDGDANTAEVTLGAL